MASPVTDRQSIQRVPHLSPNSSWNGLLSPGNPELDKTGKENGLMESFPLCLSSF